MAETASAFQPNGRYQKFEVFNQLIGDANLLRAGDFGESISAAHWFCNRIRPGTRLTISLLNL